VYKRKVLHMTFEDHEGLDVYVRSVSVKRALRLMRLAGEMDDAKPEQQAQKDVEELFGAFADRVVSWSLVEDDETPVPVSLEALLDWDFDVALAMVLTWIQQATSVTVPTAAPANGTGSPLEASIPMASASGM
jgi:hypothetical protein